MTVLDRLGIKGLITPKMMMTAEGRTIAIDAISKSQMFKGLSPEEIASITADTDEHTALVKVVQQASEDNLSKAQLVDNIKALGAVAVKIAKKIPQFTALL